MQANANDKTGDAGPVAAPQPIVAPDVAELATARLSNQEREVILALRRVNFFRAGKERSSIVHWNGVKVRIFDGQQV